MEPIMSESLFEVAKVTQIKSDEWLVEGRAYKPLKIGDFVSIVWSPDRSDSQDLSYEIIAIYTYDRSVEELSQALTGGLVLRGPRGEALREASVLCSAPFDQL
jgi:hypothetical protein